MAAVSAAAACGVASLMAAPPPVDEKAAAENRIRDQVAELRARVSGSEPLGAVAAAADKLLDEAATLTLRDGSLLPEVAALRRAVRHWASFKPDEAAAMRKLLSDEPSLVQAVALAIEPTDRTGNAYAVLRLIHEKFPERVAAGAGGKGKPSGSRKLDLANLVAAFCVTHDLPPGERDRDRKDPGKPPPIDAERITELFDYYSTNAGKLAFGPDHPPQLLSFIVAPDDWVTVEDLNWSLRTQASNRAVGKLYDSITYDTNHYKRGTPKKVEQAPGGLTLQNIRKHGGVCLEQALFASNVGKAIGVPAVMVTGAGSDVHHAWVGYLKSVGNNRWAWDFSEGRYDEYEHVPGWVVHPQRGATVADSYISLTVGLIGAADKLQRSTALLDAAERLGANDPVRVSNASGAAAAPNATAPSVVRQLELIERGLRECPANVRGWELINALATRKQLSVAQVQEWSDRLLEMCGREYADFAIDSLRPMFASAGDAAEEERLWEWAALRFQKRKDLVAQTLLWRGEAWQRASQPEKAWRFYNEVIERYPNDGQIILRALERAEKLLETEGKGDQKAGLYKSAWARVKRPTGAAAAFLATSNYVKIGLRYAQLLESGNQTAEARKVRDSVESILGK